MFKKNDTRQLYSGYEILDFLRSISVLWLICLHQQNQWILQEWFDRPKFSEEEVLWWNGFAWAGHFSVDLFLLISGFLIGMIIIREQKKYQRRVNLKRFYWRRLLRIYPLLLVNFGVYLAVEIHMLPSTSCQDNWWATLFFVNNLPQVIPYPDTCMLWTWSLALEMQFYLLISLILAATPNKINVHKFICWAVVLGSFVLRMVIAIDIGALFPPAISEFGGDNRWSFELYIPGYTRIGNLFIGVLTAIYEMEAKDLDEQKRTPSLRPEDSKDMIKEGLSTSGRCCWKALKALCLLIVISFGLVNWSALLDQQCVFLADCGCNDIPLKKIGLENWNTTCHHDPTDCQQYLRLSENCGNAWLPHALQIFLLASYRTIFCGAYGILVYAVLVESKRRKQEGKPPTWYLRFFAKPVWFFLAQISYGMYLWNQMLIYVVQLAFFENTFKDNLHTSFLWKMLVLLACIAFTILFAMVTYVLVEKPFMDIRDYSKFLKQVKGAEGERTARVMSVSPGQEAPPVDGEADTQNTAPTTREQNQVALA